MPEVSFCNVDLELESRSPLDQIVQDFGEDAIVLHHGMSRGLRLASFETTGVGSDAETTINSLCNLVENLSDEGRQAWDRCLSRIFDIGYESGDTATSFQSVLHPATVRRVADLNAGIVITVYPTGVPVVQSRESTSGNLG